MFSLRSLLCIAWAPYQDRGQMQTQQLYFPWLYIAIVLGFWAWACMTNVYDVWMNWWRLTL